MIIKYVLPFTLLSASFMANANLRWFDIELIFFERKLDTELKEDLSADDFKAIDYTKTKDIIAEAYQEIQTVKYKECTGELDITFSEPETLVTGEDRFERNVSEQIATSNTEIDNEDIFSDFNETQLACQKDTNITKLDALPLTPEALTQEHTDYIYLLSQEQLELSETVTRLKQRGLTPLLHTGWRQPESNIRNATPMYLYGGKNLSARVNKEESDQSLQQMLEEYTQFETAIDTGFTSSDDVSDIVDTSNSTLENEVQSNPLLTKQTWQLQGKFKVFIRHNYLNIEADFDLNDLTEQTVEQLNFDQMQGLLTPEQLTETVLKTDRFSQFRRVISSEIHYFDHPRLGIIMQIRRYNH